MHTACWAWPEHRAVALRWPHSSHKPWQPAGNTLCRPALWERRTALHSQQRDAFVFTDAGNQDSGVYTEMYQRSRKDRFPGKNTWMCAVRSRYRSTLWGWYFLAQPWSWHQGPPQMGSAAPQHLLWSPPGCSQSLWLLFPMARGISPKRRENVFSLNPCAEYIENMINKGHWIIAKPWSLESNHVSAHFRESYHFATKITQTLQLYIAKRWPRHVIVF